MPIKLDHPFEFNEVIHHNLNASITEHQEICRQHKEIERYIRKFEQASELLCLARNELKDLIKNYKNKFEKEQQKSRELTATYYLLAFNFLSDFSSAETDDMFASLRKQIKVFIYTSFNNRIAFCFQSPAFLELFKRTENLELSFWYQERIAHTSLLMQEFLDEGHGMKVEFDQLPETEMELFDRIKQSTTQQMLFFDLDKYMNRLSGTAEDSINDFNASNSNARFASKYFQFSFKLSEYIAEQMSNFAQGAGLYDLANLFTLHAEKTKIYGKSSALKEKMDYFFSILPLNIPKKEKHAPFWKDLVHRAKEAIMELPEDQVPLLKIEQEWIKRIMKNSHQVIDVGYLGILCDILRLHTKLIKGQIDLVVLEGNYDHFSFMDQEYLDIEPSEMTAILDELKQSNKEMEADIKFMQKSPDQLFQRIKEKDGTMYGFGIYNGQEDQEEGGFSSEFPDEDENNLDEE